MYPSPSQLNQDDALQLMSTMLCIADPNYCYAFPFRTHVPAILNLLVESSQHNTNNGTSQLHVLQLRCLHLIITHVPHCASFCCRDAAMTKKLFDYLPRIVGRRGASPNRRRVHRHLPNQSRGRTLTEASFQNREPIAELFEEWLIALSTVADLHPETISLENHMLALLYSLHPLSSYPERIQLKVLHVLSRVFSVTDANSVPFDVIATVIQHLWTLLSSTIPEDTFAEQNVTTASPVLIGTICDSLAVLIDKLSSNEDFLLQLAGFHTTQQDSNSALASNSTLVSHLISLVPLLSNSPESQGKILNLLIILCNASPEICDRALSVENLSILVDCLVGKQGFLSLQQNNSNLLQMSRTFLTRSSTSPTLQQDILLLLRTLFPSCFETGVISSPHFFTTEIFPQHAWNWEDDYHNKNSFDPYSTIQLERAYKNGNERVNILGRYQIIFSEMKQYNVQTGVQRGVHRSALPHSYERRTLDLMNSTSGSQEGALSQIRNQKRRRIQRKRGDSTSNSSHSGRIDMQSGNISLFLSMQVVPQLLRLCEETSSATTQQDTLMLLSSIFYFCDKSILSQHVNLSDTAGLCARMLRIALSTSEPDSVVVSYSILLLQLIVNRFPLQQVQIALLKHGLKDILESASPQSTHSGSVIHQIINPFFSQNLQHIKYKPSSEEKQMEAFCSKLATTLAYDDILDMEPLLRIFSHDNSISERAFQNSDFASLFISYLYPQRNQGVYLPHQRRLSQLFTLLKTNPSVLRRLVIVLRSCIHSLRDNERQVQAVVPSSNHNGDAFAASLSNLEQLLDVDFRAHSTHETSHLGALSHATECSFDPFCTIKEIKHFLLPLFSQHVGYSTDNISLFIPGEDTPLPEHMTLLRVAQRRNWSVHGNASFASIWSKTYQLEYKWKDTSVQQQAISDAKSPLFLSTTITQCDEIPKSTQNALHLLRVLSSCINTQMDSISSLAERIVLHDAFLSSKLVNKVQSPLCLLLSALDSLPKWISCISQSCDFLFQFDAKRMFFYYSQFGAERALHAATHTDATETSTVCIHKDIHRLSIENRHYILPEAAKVMKTFAGTRTILEFEYSGEAGIGLGPTLEFYTLVCQQLQALDVNMWQTIDDSHAPYVNAPRGLFPKSLSYLSQEEKSNTLERFTFLGRFIGKALEDNRLLDLPLSLSFVKRLFNSPLTLDDLPEFSEPSLYQSVSQICGLSRRKQEIESLEIPLVEKQHRLRNLQEEIEGLYLTFQFGDSELIENGANVDVTLNNISDFSQKLTEHLLVSSSQEQVEAVRRGLAEVLHVNTLCMFSPQEFKSLLCGEPSFWSSRDDIEKNLVVSGFDNGVQNDCVQWLIDFMLQLDHLGKKNFLEFATGTTSLPVGGLSSLKPKLTVVCVGKTNVALPTCNTCIHKLKLPEYSSKNLLFDKVGVALQHGRKSFDLS